MPLAEAKSAGAADLQFPPIFRVRRTKIEPGKNSWPEHHFGLQASVNHELSRVGRHAAVDKSVPR